MTILTIDFEASCLPRHGRSFPIEVGIAGDDMARSWIIRPHADWADWDWTVEAEGLHGLTRDRIEREGQAADAVLAQLAAAVDGRPIVADSMIDQYWLDTLAAAAGVSAPFAIDHVTTILDGQGVGASRIAAAVAFANARHPTRHRAVSDALWLHAVLRHVGDAMAQRSGSGLLTPAR
ncbi:MAG: hypothetical protein PSY12_05405 [bacterium]|nr:hypothetical protein [bacterium]